MPLVPLTKADQRGPRVLVTGPPNSRKTASLLTWPRSQDEKLVILSYPGEKGYDTIPLDDPAILPLVWRVDDPGAKISPVAVVREIERMTFEVLTGKHGPVKTFAGDGLHKLYEWYLATAFLERGPTKDGDDDPKAFGDAHREFLLYLTRVCHSGTPYVVFTVWDGAEKDDARNKQKDAPSHIYPDLPGKMAKRIMGEFSWVLYSEVGVPGPTGESTATWQLQPSGAVWGAGMKVSPDVARKLPKKVPQDFQALERLVKGVQP